MEKMERLVGRSYREFEIHLEGMSERTKTIYSRGLLKFLEHYDLDTEKLYKQYIDDKKSKDKRDKAKVGKMVISLMTELQKDDPKRLDHKQRYSGSYVSEIMKGVNAFFKANSEEVVYTGKSMIDKSTNGKERMRTEYLTAILDVTGSMRNKSIITIGKDTGLRVSDIANIRVKHVIDAIKENREFHTFEIEVEKTTKETGVKANPVIGPDTIKYLRLWWKERAKYGCGENPEDYLYCVVEDKPEHTRAGKVIPEQHRGDPLDSPAISTMIYRLIKKAGLEVKNISAHSMRKFHETMLQAGHVPDMWIDRMTGRAEGYKGGYVKPDEKQLIEAYRPAYSQLSLTPMEISEVERRKQNVLDTVKLLGWSEEKIESLKKSLDGRMTLEQIGKRIKELTEKEQAIVEEKDLSNHLSHGWKFVSCLSNGKCIIEKS